MAVECAYKFSSVTQIGVAARHLVSLGDINQCNWSIATVNELPKAVIKSYGMTDGRYEGKKISLSPAVM